MTQVSKKKTKDPVTKALIKFLIKLVTILIIIVSIFTFIFGLERFEDESMIPAIKPGDMILYYRLDKKFLIGETVVYSYDGADKIGRVVAMPGDKVDFNENGIIVNGSNQYEPNIYKPTLPFTDGIKYPVTLADDEVFLLADNRDKTVDSRLFGPVKINLVKGKIFTILRRRGI